MKTFVEELVDSVSKTELDLKYPYYENGKINKVFTPDDRLYCVEAPSIEIDEVIKILNDLKQKGANRVYIADDSDAYGYYFYGVKLVEV
jgi:hypothetical protein